MINEKDNSYLELLTTEDYLDVYFTHLHSQFDDISDNVLWLVNNLLTDRAKCRDQIMNSKIYDYVQDILTKEDINIFLLRSGIWFMSCLMKNKQTIPDDAKIMKSLYYCVKYLYIMDPELNCQCVWGIYYISEFESSNLQIFSQILSTGAIEKIIKINFKQQLQSLSPCLRLLGNLLSGEYNVVDQLISMRVVNFYEAVLANVSKSESKREVLWGLSNLSAGSIQHVHAIIDSPIFDKIVLALGDSNYSIKREAVYIIKNCLSNNCVDISTIMLNKGAMKGLVHILQNDSNQELTFYTLKSVAYFVNVDGQSENNGNLFISEFEALGGRPALEKLTMNQESEISVLAKNILEKY